MWRAVGVIALGATLGALLRWQLGVRWNNAFSFIPPGTLAANLIGAYVVGLAIGFFSSSPNISPEWRLLIITGFCGGLTTFSTFSVEIVTLLQQQRIFWALAAISTHVIGSLLMTFAGLLSWQAWAAR